MFIIIIIINDNSNNTQNLQLERKFIFFNQVHFLALIIIFHMVNSS